MAALRPITEQEAFGAALRANDAHPESHFADKLAEKPGEFWACNLVRESGPGFDAVCVYFAVRSGSIVLRAEPVAWSDVAECIARLAWDVWQASQDPRDVELEQLRRATGSDRATEPRTWGIDRVEWIANAHRWIHDPTYPAHAGYIVAARGLAAALGYRGGPVAANGEGWSTATVEKGGATS